MADDASEPELDRVELDAVTLNAAVDPAVRPVTVQDVSVEDEAEVHVPAVGEAYVPPSIETETV